MSSISSRWSFVVCHLSLFILLLPAIQPLVTGDLTCGYDNAFHLWRAVEVEHLLQQGVLFSRWAPNMAQGYGYPLLNFTAPASAYGVALLRLLGLQWPWALNLAFAAGWVLSAYAMHLFVSDAFDHYAGLVAAVLYAYVPFHAYDVFYRGGLSQSSAWPFPPLVLWALRRADKRGGFALAALGFTGLVLTHNAFALLFTPLLVIYLFVVGYQSGRKTALWGGMALLVGLGVSAFFWLPALSDLRFVHSERLSGAWVLEYVNNFLPLNQLFASPRAADSALINDWPARGLGLIPALLAMVGIIALRKRQYRPQVAFFAGALVLYLFLTLPVSRPIWDALPLLQRVQFPWRLVGPATLCAAVLAGAVVPAGMETRPTLDSRALSIPHRLSPLVPAGLILVLILAHLGWFYPRHCRPPADISTTGMIAWERATDTVGTTAKGEYLPTWVHHMPDVPAFDATHTAGDPIVRLSPESLPEGAQVIRADYGPVDATIELETPTPFQARYLAFYYPGWQVRVDGSPVPIASTDPEGLISLNVPAGRHTVRIHFGETPLRLTADIISLLSLAALAAILTLRPPASPSSNLQSPISNLPLFALALLIVITKVVILDRVETPLRRSNLVDGRLRNVDVAAEIMFGDEFVLLGHGALPEIVPSGGQIEIRTFWRALQPGGPDYGVTVNVVDAQGYRWNSLDIRPSRWHRTPPPAWEWPPDQYAAVVLSVPLLPGIPPGTYTVEAVAFDQDTLVPLTAHDADGRAIGPALPLSQIAVSTPHRQADLDALDVRQWLNVPIGPLNLVGANFDRDQAAPGDALLLTLFWQAAETPAQELGLRLRLLDHENRETAAFALPLVRQDFPTSQWQAGDLWRGQHQLRLPARLDGGVHRWTLQVCQMEGVECPALGQEIILDTLQVNAPERLWDSPLLDVETDARLGGVVTLLGAALQPEVRDLKPGTPLTTTLVWQAEAEMMESYRVFLHLLGPDGGLLSQSDGEPAGWTRPTTGWLPGEVVLDQRVLTVHSEAEPGEYRLQAGMYTLEGGRLTTPQGADSVLLTIVVVSDRE